MMHAPSACCSALWRQRLTLEFSMGEPSRTPGAMRLRSRRTVKSAYGFALKSPLPDACSTTTPCNLSFVPRHFQQYLWLTPCEALIG